MKSLLLISALTLLTSCGQVLQSCQSQPNITEYIILNPAFVGKCFKHGNEAYPVLVTGVTDQGYKYSTIQLIKSYKTNKLIIVAVPSDYSRVGLESSEEIKCPKIN